MIHKIDRLISIGKFKNYTATGDVAFRKLTLVYGDNGGGKTTLTSVLRSLTENRPELIFRRKSVNQSTLQAQAAQIVEQAHSGVVNHTFHHTNGWAQAIPGIEIFDAHFVNENIYSGFDFSDEHKKNFHQFVVGAVGVALQQQIEQNKTQKTSSRQNQTLLENEIISTVGNNLNASNLGEFLTTTRSEAVDIDGQIATANAALVSAQASVAIRSWRTPVELSVFNTPYNIAGIATDLGSTTDTIQEEALKALFTNHCQDLNDNGLLGAENWLRDGYKYLEVSIPKLSEGEPSTCPFCDEPINSGADLLRAYSQKFNEAFNALTTRLQTYFDNLQRFHLAGQMQDRKRIAVDNAARVANWSAHLPSTVVAPNFVINVSDESLEAQVDALRVALQTKLRNPSVAVDTRTTEAITESMYSIVASIGEYNTSVRAYNVAVDAFRIGIRSVVDAQKEVDRLNRVKMRYVVEVDTLCTRLSTERQTLATLEAAYPPIVSQLQAETTTFFSTYKDRINHYLGTIFKTPFQLDSISHVAPQGRGSQSKVSYKLLIDGNEISFNHTDQTNVKDCLSEGDKSTIALAFFLSRLDLEPDLANKILVFDDPLSSFDGNRRMYTVQLIKDFVPRIRQAIVLSHNEFFLFEVSKGFSAGDKKALRVAENFTTRESRLEPLSLEELVENDYIKHIKALEDFLISPDIGKKEIVLGWLRNVLEAHIRFKFYRQICSIPANSQTLGRLITALVDQNVTFRDSSPDTLNKLNLINGISCRPHHGDPMPDWTLGFDPNRITATELASFIRDTLDLVDNKL